MRAWRRRELVRYMKILRTVWRNIATRPWVYLGAAFSAIILAYVPPQIFRVLGLETLPSKWDKTVTQAEYGFVLLAGLIFMVGIYVGMETVSNVLRPRSRISVGQEAYQRSTLILTLSNIRGNLLIPEGFTLGNSFSEDISRLATDSTAARWPWAQSLRAIYHHVRHPNKEQGHGLLQRIVILASDESLEQVPFFYQSILGNYQELRNVEVLVLCRRQIGGGTILISPSQPTKSYKGLDFLDFTAVVESTENLIDQLKRRFDINESNISFDITGGPKLASIAIASATINQNIQLQYVSTNPEQAPDEDAPVFPVLGYSIYA